MTFIQLPYVIVSRFEYDWLVFSRNSLAFIAVILIVVLYDTHRTRTLPNIPKDEPATPAFAEE
jgi:hypothetical protein